MGGYLDPERDHYARLRPVVDYVDLMMEAHGLRLATARECPRTVAGKHCRIGYVTTYDNPCECHIDPAHLLDHKQIWIDS